jgi:dihydroorotate dehydrogenase
VAQGAGVDAIIATNTTLAREGLRSPHAAEKGGLSGRPLFERSTRVLARLSQATGGRIPLVGVGGVDSAEAAYAKIKAGATAVQLYTGLVYGGLSLAGDIARGVDAMLDRDGHTRLEQAVGKDRGAWL